MNRTLASVLFSLVFVIPSLAFADRDDDARSAVFVSTNAASGNAVVAFERTDGGSLVPAGTFATGGAGTGAALGSQGAVTLADHGRVLLVVDAGSDELSSFRVDGAHLTLASRVAAGGVHPISVAARGDLVYALFDGGDGGVSGFRLLSDGRLEPIADSTRALQPESGPAQVAIAPDGRSLVVTDKAANAIDVFAIARDGRAATPVRHASAGTTPFGFDFTPDGVLVVSEAAGGAAAASTVSSYVIGHHHALDTISAAVPDHQTAACWIAIGRHGRYAYTTNAGSNSISTYAVEDDGSLDLIDEATATASHPTDEATTRDGRALVVVDGGNVLQSFAIGDDGALVAVSSASLPAGSVGVAAN